MKTKVPQPLKWHGGKAYMAQWIQSLMPKHTRYCEPFFGGGAVLFDKPCEGVAEFINDINRNLSHFWFVLGDAGLFPNFARRAACSPLSKPLFLEAKERLRSRMAQNGDGQFPRLPVDAAVDLFVVYRQSRQALGKDFCTPTSRLRRGMNEQVSAWLSAVDGLVEAHERLRRVEIRCMDAVDFIKELDSPDTLFYCDPPYVHDTRTAPKAYAHEMTNEQHRKLLGTLADIKGKFLLSGYIHPLYIEYQQAKGWTRHEKKIDNKASSKKEKEVKTECVWCNF